MTNAPDTRKTHVIRILGTNKAGDVLPDIWADVERIDEAKSVTQGEETGFQGAVRRLTWQDDPDQDDYSPDGPASRKMRVLKVCAPDEADASDPQEWIPIPVIDKMRALSSGHGTVRTFANDGLNSARVVNPRRILHYDTSIDAEAQAAFDADPARRVLVVPAERYSRMDDTRDAGQWLEHEVIMFLKGQDSGESGTGQGNDQGKQTKLLNQYLIDESEEARLEVVGGDGTNPPWRLDPFQNIVNVQLGGATRFPVIGTVLPDVFKTPANLAPSSKFTASIKFRFNNPNAAQFSATLFTINNDDAADNSGISVGLIYSPDGLGLDADILFIVTAGTNVSTVYAVSSYSNFLSGGIYDEEIWNVQAQGSAFCASGVFRPRDWNLLHFALDTSAATTTGEGFETPSNGPAWPIVSGSTIDMRLNGVPCFTSEIVPYSLARSQFMHTAFVSNDGAGRAVTATSSTGDVTTIPGFQIGYGTADMKIPGGGGDFESIDLFDVYAWVGQAIPSAQYGNFIRAIADGVSVAAPTADVIGLYGQPSYLFTGRPNRFVVNGGTAGPVTGVDLQDQIKSTSKPKFNFT